MLLQTYKTSSNRLLIFGLVECLLSFEDFSTGGLIVSIAAVVSRK